MATKDQKIKSLELENIDLGEKLNGVSEIAGDLFIGLALAADMIQEQQAMLEIDALVLSIADEVIGQQKNEINRMQRAESRRQSQEEEEKRNKAKLAEVRNMPSLVDWALVNVEATANGMDFTAKPDRWGRKRVTTTVDYWCDSCETWHYQDDFRTGVKTSPVNTERRSSGCGGY